MGEIEVRARWLAIYDRRLAPVTAALLLGLRIPARNFRPVPHDRSVVGWTAEIRDRYLADVALADHSRGVLRALSRARLERRVALQMIGALLDALGNKNDEAALAAMVDLLEGDPIASASKLWEPIDASPTALALASKKLIATQVFPLNPAELPTLAAKPSRRWTRPRTPASGWWSKCARPTRSCSHSPTNDGASRISRPRFGPVLPKMLELHEVYGDGSAAFDEGRSNPFGAAIERAKADLLPELIEGSAELTVRWTWKRGYARKRATIRSPIWHPPHGLSTYEASRKARPPSLRKAVARRPGRLSAPAADRRDRRQDRGRCVDRRLPGAPTLAARG